MFDTDSLHWTFLGGPEGVSHVVRIALLVFLAFPIVIAFSAYVHSQSRKRFSKHSAMLARKTVFYAGTVLIVVAILAELNFKLTALLGAAGIAGIAIGFASQTSVSNIISGLFLLIERPFSVGDMIQTSGMLGTVESIDLLSIKIRTPDNRYVRIPNEKVVKGIVTNITRLPVRRLDITVTLPVETDAARVAVALNALAVAHAHCLDFPPSTTFLKGISGATQEFFFAVWCDASGLLALRSSIVGDIRKRLVEEGLAPAGALTVKMSDEPVLSS